MVYIRIFFLCFFISGPSVSYLSAQKVIFSDNFESGTIASPWLASSEGKHGTVRIFKFTIPDSNRVVRLGKIKDGEQKLVVNRLDLPIDLSFYPKITLQFDITHYGEETHPQDGIYISTDGGRFFTKIYSFNFEQWNSGNTGTSPRLDLTLLAQRKKLSLNSQTVIRFQQYGSHDFVGSSDFSDGIQLDNIQLEVPHEVYASLPFKEDFEGQAWHPALSKGCINDFHQPFSPFGVVETIHYDSVQRNIVRLGNQYDGQFTTNTLDLRIDLSSQVAVELLFKILSNHDETHSQDGIFFSSDGGKHFTKVFDFRLESWRKKEFGSYPPISINQLARQHSIPLSSEFVVRFQQHDDDDFSGSRLSSDGIYLDDIEVREAISVYAEYPFFEDFEKDSLATYWKVKMADLRDTAVAVTPAGKVALVSSSTGNAIVMGSKVDQWYNTNALDLYINLSEAKNPELSFDIFNQYDETHPQDGIYFSKDGGENFIKVFHFDGSHWANRVWGSLHALDIRKLASKHKLKFTNRFVIRFQQHGDDDLEGTRTLSDGIYLDNVSIKEPSHQYYADLPFIETFESDSLVDYWRKGDLSKTIDEKLIRPGGCAVVINDFDYSNSRVLALGRETDGELTTSAYDLHLDLTDQSNLELNFRMLSHTTETQPENSIWISNDGGESFQLAYHFQPPVPQQFGYYSLNFDSLIEGSGLDYSNQFVIRFQHTGDRSFLGKGSFASGAFLDDIVLTNQPNPPDIRNIQLSYMENSGQQKISWPFANLADTYQTQLFIEEVSETHLVQVQTTAENSVSFTTGTMLSGQLYYLRIRSVNSYSKSRWSAPIAISVDHEGQISMSTLTVRLP